MRFDLRYLSYIPHGINPNKFFPITEQSDKYNSYQKFKKEQLDNLKVDFIALFNSRNIRRKMPSDIILAFKKFTDTLTPEQADKCALMLHTDPIDPNGTDLGAVINAICPNRKVIFSNKKINTETLNFIYNLCDVSISASFAEGWGLTVHESLMAGTMAIAPVTGGLQDQMGFRKEDGSLLTENDYTDSWHTNSTGRYKEHGKWIVPMFPTSRRLVGSPPTPYIMDEHVSVKQIADALKYVYDIGADKRNEYGLLGREYCMLPETSMSTEYLSKRYVKSIDTLFENYKKPNRIILQNVKYDVNRNKTTELQLIGE